MERAAATGGEGVTAAPRGVARDETVILRERPPSADDAEIRQRKPVRPPAPAALGCQHRLTGRRRAGRRRLPDAHRPGRRAHVALRRTLLGEGVDFGLLGPLLVRDGPTQVPVPARRQRVLLAALLLSPGRVVSLDALAE